MKPINAIKAASCLLITLLLCSCQQQSHSIHLSADFEEIEDNEVYLHRSADRYGYKDWLNALDTAVVVDGSFSFNVPAETADYYQVSGASGYPLMPEIYLAPGDSMHVTVPVRTDSTRAAYHGARAGAYAIHDKVDSLWRNDTTFSMGNYEIAQMAMDSAMSFLRDRYHVKRGVITAHFHNKPDWKPVENLLLDQAFYRMAREHYDYLYYHNYYANDTFVYLIADPSFYQFVDSLDMGEVPAYYSPYYMNFMEGYLRDKFLVDNREHARQCPICQYV